MDNQEKIEEEVTEAVEAEAEEEESAEAEKAADDDMPFIMPGPLGKFFTYFFGFR